MPSSSAEIRSAPALTREPFGVMPDGTPVEAFTLTNPGGVEVRVITYGGIITSIRMPDRDGVVDNVVLGYDTLEGYLAESPYFGAIVGRYANRIARGRFTLDGITYQLAVNDGVNHLHGGVRGFDKVVWRAEPFTREDRVGVMLAHTSPDGDEGYPGTLRARVTYALTARDELCVKYEATTDRATVVNLTQHTYFNLTGARRDVLGHELEIAADHYTPVDETLIPTGEIARVDGTPFDFRRPTRVGARIDDPHEQLAYAGGYDHNFVLAAYDGTLRHAARIHDPESGRAVEVWTTQPGVQFYSGNFLDGRITSAGGRAYGRRYGLCLETQHFPDSPNRPAFPSATLRLGTPYHARTTFAFSSAESRHDRCDGSPLVRVTAGINAHLACDQWPGR